MLMMHVPVFRLGNQKKLIMPYLKTLLPGAIGILGVAALVEMIFHYRHAALGDNEMTIFWTTFDSHAILPWVITSVITVVALYITKTNAPDLYETWGEANTPSGGGK